MRQEELQRGVGYRWIYGIMAGICVAAMEIGVGFLQAGQQYVVWMGLAQGTLVCSLTILCGGMVEWLLAPLPDQEEEENLILHPVRERIREYELAFQTLAGSFSSSQGFSGRRGGQQAAMDAVDKIELLWNSRMEENREAVSQQLWRWPILWGIRRSMCGSFIRMRAWRRFCGKSFGAWACRYMRLWSMRRITGKRRFISPCPPDAASAWP